MINRNARRDEDWQDHQRHEDATSTADRREREYHTSRQHEPSAANYPQYLAENRHYRRSNYELHGSSRHSDGPDEGGSGEYRYGDQPRFSPLRFGGYDEVRNDSFGYTEIERQPHSFGPYVKGGGRGTQQPHPGYYDPVYGNVGMNWSGPGYLHHPAQFQHGSPDDHARHIDPDYHQWREEQIRKLDSDYDQWRQERYQKFSEDFDTWRSTRTKHGPLPVEEPVGTSGVNKPEPPSQGATLPASGTKR